MSRDTSAYVVDGVRWPSVTEVLELAGLVDFSRVDADVLERARARGSAFHEWADSIDFGLLEGEPAPPYIAPYVAAYERFKSETGFKVEAAEQVVRNPLHRYVGTLDRRGTFLRSVGLSGPAVVELKTTAVLYPWTRLQLCGYADCEPQRPHRVAVQLRPDGTYRLEHYKDRGDFHDWGAAVRIAHYRLAHGLARIQED